MNHNHNLELLYLDTIPTQDFLKEALKNAPELHQEEKDALKVLGPEVYRFVVKDDFEKREIIKSKEEVTSFLEWYEKQHGQKLEISSLSTFEGIKKKTDANGYGETFMEMQGSQLFKYKHLKMKRLRFAKRWYQKLCQCAMDDFDNVDIYITRQGISQSMKGIHSGFLLFTSEFQYKYGSKDTESQYGITLYTAHREIQMLALNVMDYYSFLYFIRKALRESKENESRYKATSFVRNLNKVNFLIDAQNYYREVAHGIQNARHQIFMCGWWISPQLPLIRPATGQNLKYRLDTLLQTKAKEGVKINVVAFESPPLIPNDSKHTTDTLNRLSKNINAMAHPFKVIPGFWSHHQKLVVVDQQVAYMGGLDLCYGRYDSTSHPIDSSSKAMYPGIQYNNNRIKDFVNVSEYQVDALSRNLPRMPWHDVALKVKGRVVADLCNHFIEYWNNSYIEELVVEEGMKGEFKTSGIDNIVEEQKQQRIHQQEEREINCKLDHHREQRLQKRSAAKMNEGEAGNLTAQSLREQVGLSQEYVPLNLKQEQIQQKIKARQNFDKASRNIKKKHNLIKKNMDQGYLILSFQCLGLRKLDEQKWQEKKAEYIDECQLLRSASQWSIGLEDYYNQEQGSCERSIYNAYLEEIQKAKSFIYIENQFFISATQNQEIVKNRITQKLFERIERAVKQNEKFKVYVLMPLLPGMAGETDEDIPMPLRLVVHWQYQTICRGGNSLIEKVREITKNPRDYIEFYGLRQHGVLEGKPTTELIYIHTKLMIVDDLVAICGSANINDRSMLGDRDSEICLITQGKPNITRVINSREVQVNENVHNLRVALFQEHFGFANREECEDPISAQIEATISQRARKNTEIYRDLFGCPPDDKIRSYSDHRSVSKESSLTLQKYQELSKEIVGQVVEFPFHFLEKENLRKIEPDLVHKIMT